MRSFNKFSFAFVLLIGTMTHAQSPDPNAGSGSADASAGGSVSGEVTVKISVGEMSGRAASFQTQAQADLTHVVQLQAKARKDKDVIKLNCINDRLVQLKAQMNIFEASLSVLTAGLANPAGDNQGLFNDVSVNADSIKRIRAEADVCAGEDLLKQESSTTVDAPDIVDDPTTWDPEWDPSMDDVEPPGYASPFT
jgi:hypothetical protein